MTGPGCGWSKISRVRAPYDNLDPAVKPLQSPESAVYIMDSLLGGNRGDYFRLALSDLTACQTGQPRLDWLILVEITWEVLHGIRRLFRGQDPPAPAP